MEDLWSPFAAVAAARHCKRAFLDRAVPGAALEQVLAVAAQAPSTRNGQPWQVSVVSGAARDALANRLVAALEEGTPSRPDYRNRPSVVDADTERRWQDAGAGLFRAAGIDRTDAAARHGHLRSNLQFHGARTVLIFHLPSGAVPGAFLEMGMFLQSTMLGLVACGLGSCPQYSVAGYPDVIREHLGLAGRLIVCALAVGYPDPGAPVNAFVPARLAPRDFVRWHGQPPACG